MMARGIAQVRPCARTESLVVEELDGELLVYDLDRDKAHALNGPAATVWRHCDGVRTVADLGRLLAGDEGVEQGTELARNALVQLSRRHLLIEPFEDDQYVNRRDLMRKVAMAGALVLAVPVVKSIVAPTAAQAATCYPTGVLCSSSAQCCSGVCLAGVCV